MNKHYKLAEYFSEVETVREHNGYFCDIGDVLTIVILGSLCGLRNVNQIHQWASSARVSTFLAQHFGIMKIPCYYWLLCLLKLIEPKSLSHCFTQWAQSLSPGGAQGLTLALDGKTIRSTGKMARHDSALHIVSAHVAELGVTFGQRTVCGKSNEIPAVRELLGQLRIQGCLVVADALHCQKETAKAIADGKAEYLLNVKDNQPDLKKDIEAYVQDDVLRKAMDTHETREKNGGRLETRTAFATRETGWLHGGKQWAGLVCVGAINTRFATHKGTTNEWHYYISSRALTASELLRRARLEWSVETMHWLLDVHFGEDFCRVEDLNVQQNLNIVRKIALNCVKTHKRKSALASPLSKMMFDCLLDCEKLIPVLQSIEKNEN